MRNPELIRQAFAFPKTQYGTRFGAEGAFMSRSLRNVLRHNYCRKILAAVLLLAILNSCTKIVFCQSFSKSPAQRHLDERMPIWLKAFNVTGVGIGYIENGRLAWTAFYGDQIPGGPPAGEKTLYSVASLTKPITAEILLRLASAGKLSLDESISPYWIDPDLAGDSRTKLLTARICLTHQTGFPNWRYQTDNHLKFQWEPGTRFGYSGEGYDYVAHFVENKTGIPFEQLAQQYVFTPIGMENTSYTPRTWWEGRQAKPVESGPRTKWSGADLLRTTVRDYASFVIAVMHNTGISDEVATERARISRNLITPESESAACELAKDPAHCTLAMGFGLGWRIVKLNGRTIFDHTGADGDVKTFAFFIPEEKMGAVIFTDGPDVEHDLIDKVLGTLVPDPVYDSTLWQRFPLPDAQK